MAQIPNALNTQLTAEQVLEAFDNALNAYPETKEEVETARGAFNTLNDRIDSIENKVVPAISESIIDNTLLDIITDSAVMTGTIDATIHGTANTYGVIRAYILDDTENAEVYMQIAEFVDGTKKTRYYSSSTWSVWT